MAIRGLGYENDQLSQTKNYLTLSTPGYWDVVISQGGGESQDIDKMSQNPEAEVSSSKMKKLCPVEYSRKSFKSRKSMKLTKEIFGGQIFKRPAFGLRCADFAQNFFKSHVITKYEKSRSFRVPFLIEKLSNCASKKVRGPKDPSGQIGLRDFNLPRISFHEQTNI